MKQKTKNFEQFLLRADKEKGKKISRYAEFKTTVKYKEGIKNSTHS